MQVLRPEDLRGSHGGYHVVCQVCKVEIPVADFPGGKVRRLTAKSIIPDYMILRDRDYNLAEC